MEPQMGGITVHLAQRSNEVQVDQVQNLVFDALTLSGGKDIRFMANGRSYVASAGTKSNGEIGSVVINLVVGGKTVETVYSSQKGQFSMESPPLAKDETNIAKQLWNQAVKIYSKPKL
jgi:hypothetical protein